MYERNVMHIVYAADDKFAEIMGVSITSLFYNNSQMKQIYLYILDSGISEQNKNKVEKLCIQYNRAKPQWLNAKDIIKELGANISTDRGSISQYTRLFISSMLPSNLERVLYLDCDIIINQSLTDLWNLDLQGKIIGALLDAFSRQYRANINLPKEAVMFNSGVMLVDMERWVKNNIEGKLKQFIRQKNGRIQQGDQGALNAVLSEDTYCFEPRFNSVTIFYDFSYQEMLTYRKPPYFYSEKEIKNAVDNPVLIHFTTSFLGRRPWYEGCRHRYVEKWLYYKEISPWRLNKLWTHQRKKSLADIYVFMFHMMPRKFSIWLSGLLQAYGRPLMVSLASIISKINIEKKSI